MTQNQENYFTIHGWLIRTHGKAKFCSFNKAHRSMKFEWANIAPTYSRNINNFIPLCPSCHRKLDYTEQQRKKVSMANLGNQNARKYSKEFHESGAYALYRKAYNINYNNTKRPERMHNVT